MGATGVTVVLSDHPSVFGVDIEPVKLLSLVNITFFMLLFEL